MSNQKNFLITKEYLYFSELCDMCKKYGYIGICYGTPGVGKTLSARYYSKWDIIEPLLPPDHLVNPLPIEEISECDSIFYTAPVTSSPARIEREINKVITNLNWLIGDITTTRNKKKATWDKQKNYTNLIIIDEADRLKQSSLEQVRDIHDKTKVSILLIGMPNIEKKLSRYAQFYSRVGFVHNFKPIENAEIQSVIKAKASELGIIIEPETISIKEALAEVVRTTKGNFRLIERLFNQIDRVMKINNVNELDKELVETAKASLLIGTV